jgi:hypothetical protein
VADEVADPARLRRREAGFFPQGDGPTVARLVARTQRAMATTTDTAVVTPTPRWLPLLMEQITKTNQGVQRAIGRVERLDSSDAAFLGAPVRASG